MPKQTSKYSLKMAADSVVELIIYEEISSWWGITAQNIANQLKELRAANGTINTIRVRINSPGGDVFEGVTIYNLLKQDSAFVEVYVDGMAASIASIIAMAGDKIVIGESAAFMIHNPWSYAWGESDELRKMADLLDQIKSSLMTTYQKRTGLSEEEITALMDEETWYFGQEAVDAGFADEVFEAPAMAASLNSKGKKRLQNITENIPDKALAFFQSATNQANRSEQPENPEGSAPQHTKEKAPMPKEHNQAAAGGNPTPAASDTSKTMTAQERNDQISAIFTPFNGQHTDLLIECMSDTTITPEQAKDKLLNRLGAGTSPSTPSNNVHVHADNGRIVFDGLLNALEARVFKDVKAEKDNPYKSFNLQEMARASLSEKGVNMSAYDSRMNMVAAAFTHSTSDFGNVLADVAHKAMLRGWDETPETFTRWTREGTLTDFKPTKRVGLNTFPSLKEVAEGAEFKYGNVSDRGESILLATYGKLFSITRQAIINDDLSVFTRLPQAMGRAAARTVGDLVYAILTGNPEMSDGVKLFASAHKNTLTGGLSIENLDKGRTLMRTHKDGDAHLNIGPGYLLTPVALEGTAGSLLRSEADPSKTNSKAANPVFGMAESISEARLDSASAATSYLVAGDMYDTIEVAYMDGNPAPRLEQQQGWDVDGTQFKVALDAGVAPMDFRSFLEIKG
ncbi:ClpP-like prohead protease/major capsid protein fusion protein [Endozoicomonas sp. SCSIO W0465]|uniref:ClpP-like prohead protease/major capsid protein fusion protein n=1 Tax=Endozoicomonas sp. SCSIO W0465 TaxID=2918516 RepID=UPI002075083C|nr:ClpP-like prohead protease/major capsid protein fusion protein [Endozoicomonas sp. SCSIO W0465]USE38936.1 Clp protease ClpP [Endozoicomonas sp. SCSIO W0465]